ncbi:DsrE family protein [Lentilactobacillus sp. IMAU92037]|uniref:DsrE family protein n=1 Tax=Lentilactobacillus TaxID=2767893 RepID=UPI001C26CA57|nr:MULTISPECIES: DsrE family protein [Lentilactobacillus]MBU9788702.1 DsrE family protein [Lentilactobacillus dabitei]MBV0929475.1 DsrE family protein [Lentilactobacillus dabitei]MDM7516147.1 DsrE family protein [Lentilactobacillus sp. TOM.63]
MHKVVFHIDDMDKWQHTLGNIRNLLTFGNQADETYKIVVLVNGDAILGYLVGSLQDSIAQLTTKSVEFHACQNAMNSHTIKKDQLPAGVQVVPAGVADLVELQEAGYSYIKP